MIWNGAIRKIHTSSFLPTIQIKYYNVMIYRRQFFDLPIKNDLRTYKNIWKTAICQGDRETTGFLLEYPYFRKYNNPIAINLSKQQALDTDLKAI